MIHHVPVALGQPKAQVPAKGSEQAAGYDLHATGPAVLMPGARALFPTGVHIAIPDGHVGYIRPRSGLALKHGIDVLGGVIDSDYRGDVGVILINHGTKPFEVVEGDRIAQLVFHPLTPVLLVEGGSLGVSARGTGGFGSTGVGVL